MKDFSRNQIVIIGILLFVLCLILVIGGGILYLSLSSMTTTAVLQPLAKSTQPLLPIHLPSPTNTLAPETGDWQSSFGTSAFDDSKTVTLSLLADNPVDGWLTTYTPSLYLRCQEHKLDAYINVGMQINVEEGLFQSATVRVRFDSEEEQDMVAAESTDGKALFLPDPSGIINSMLNHNKMTFGFIPFNASPVVTTFNLTGLSGVIGPLQTACSSATSFTLVPPYLPPEAPTATPLPAGSSIVVNNWEIKVDKIIIAPSVSAFDREEKAQGRFALVFMSVTNRGLSTNTFVAFGTVDVMDAQQRFQENAVASSLAQTQYNTDIGAYINPDATNHVVAVYDISVESAYYLLVPGMLAPQNGMSLLLDVPK